MDKVKQNAFWIAVGGTGVVLLALVYFLLIDPLSNLRASQEDLEMKRQDIERLAKKKQPPTKLYKEHLDAKKAADEAAFAKGRAFYDVQGKSFDLYFDDAETPPGGFDFSGRYKTEIEKLVTAYQEKFQIKKDEQNPELTTPKVEMMADIGDDKVPAAMKEFWVIQEVIKACDKLGLAGLRAITFAGRAGEAREKDTHENYKLVRAGVQIELQFSKVENLMAELFASSRVPFQLDELAYQKAPESMAPYADLKREARYENRFDAQKAEYSEVIPEPSVIVELKLSAFDWLGMPDQPLEAETAPKGDETEKKVRKTSKKK